MPVPIRDLPGAVVALALACAALAACEDGLAGDRPTGSGVRVEPELIGRIEITRPFTSPSHRSATHLGDCDGDGRADLVRLEQNVTVGRVLADGRITRRDVHSIPALPFQSAALGDVDGDGLMDLVLGGRHLQLHRGTGPCEFGEAELLHGDRPGAVVHVQLVDADSDGLADVVAGVAADPEAAERLFLARGDGRFEEVHVPPTPPTRDAFDERSYNTYGVFLDDVDGDGAHDLFTLADQSLGWFSWGTPGDVPSFSRDETLSQRFVQVDPMGLAPLDFDRDGRMDYFVSGVARMSQILWNRGGRRLQDAGRHTGVANTVDTADWSPFSFDADLDGWPDVLVFRTDNLHYGPAPMALWMNRRDGTFVDVGPSVLGASFEGREMSCGDVDASGRATCFVQDQQGVAMLRNGIEAKGGWVGVRLRGTVSAADASGARVSLEGDERPLVAVYGGQAPTYRQHDPAVVLATGARADATLRIAWPSGLEQRVGPVPVGEYAFVTEPVALKLSTRIAPADGSSEVEIVADPKAAGAKDATIELDGAGSWKAPAATGADGLVRRTLVAPRAPGRARIVVAFDGRALRVRPRVRFVPPE